MNKQRPGMTFIEMIICLTILAVTVVALVKGVGNYVQLSARGTEDEVLVARTEALLMELEGKTPEVQSGVLIDEWHYTTHLEGEYYTLEVWNTSQEKTYDFIIQEATS